MKKKFNINLILILFPIMILVGKIIRWTILKTVLVDMSIGNGMISRILYENGGFTSFPDTGISDAAGNASVFFRMINIFGLTTTKQFEVYISVIWNIIIAVIILKSKKSLSTIQMLFLIASVAVLNIWDFCLAKEPVQLLFFLAIYYTLLSKKMNIKCKYILTILILLISVLYYRIYYILIMAFIVIVAIICNKWLFKVDKIKFKNIIGLLIILSVIYFIMLNFIKLVDVESYNELIRVRTRTGVANTQMINIFKSTNLFLFTLDYLIMIVRMLFPVELIPMGIKYWPYVFYQVLISYFVLKNIKNIKKNTKIQNLALYIYIAFLLGSATFEPDFGSWVRHEAAIFPILMIITNIVLPNENQGDENEKNNSKNNEKNTIYNFKNI